LLAGRLGRGSNAKASLALDIEAAKAIRCIPQIQSHFTAKSKHYSFDRTFASQGEELWGFEGA
jgi:hypothetical protein